jgi:hypothetical protein
MVSDKVVGADPKGSNDMFKFFNYLLN